MLSVGLKVFDLAASRKGESTGMEALARISKAVKHCFKLRATVVMMMALHVKFNLSGLFVALSPMLDVAANRQTP